MADGQPAPTAVLVERAPAKVNLSLAVVGRREDGYHRLDSLVAFARVADEVRLEPFAPLSLAARGPMAEACGHADANLVIKAARLLAERVPGLQLGRFTLLKRLPVAAGLGGGSADAGAALRLLARLNRLDPADPRLLEAAGATGSDVPVCLASSSRRMTGAGEGLSAPVALARMPAVLVNPRKPTPTGPVFAALRLAPGSTHHGCALPDLDRVATRAGLLAELHRAGNDLEAPAMALEPAVGEAIAVLGSDPGCRLVRMSGSGATVFGLFDSCRAAAAAAKRVRAERPGWWVVPTMIG
jgi:4-diphosphocytidyl-2-C-methyl-D-erythritol kinase